MGILNFLKFYGNALITFLALLASLPFTPHSDTPPNLDLVPPVVYAIGAITYSSLMLWVFSVGLLLIAIQPIYGLVRVLITEKEKRGEFLPHVAGGLLAVVGLGLIMIRHTG